jgi:hypothetical protein
VKCSKWRHRPYLFGAQEMNGRVGVAEEMRFLHVLALLDRLKLASADSQNNNIRPEFDEHKRPKRKIQKRKFVSKKRPIKRLKTT